MTPLPVAFYAPLKSPAHPLPSGDRTMARLFMRALEKAGLAPHLASEIRTLDKIGDPTTQENLKRESHEAAANLIADYQALPSKQRPRLWFTYHVYYKAPDWIGPRVADALAIPYVVAEGSRSAKRAQGPWALGHRGAEAALDRADLILVMTDEDREALQAAKPSGQMLAACPPFLDPLEWSEPAVSVKSERAEPRLLSVAMMRNGDKLSSYRILAEALGRITDLAWTLDIVGDGEARGNVEELFRPLGKRVRFQGRIEDRAHLREAYAMADLFLWPAVNEAYGMVFLEAQFCGCPVIAGAFGGVASVVWDGMTGRLTPPGDVQAFARATRDLIGDAAVRRRMGAKASRFVREERSLEGAAARLKFALNPLLTKETA